MTAEIWKPERRRGKRRVSTLDDAIETVRALVNAKREEEFYVILLDAKNQVIGEELLVQGTVDRVAVFPRKVLELALSRRAAAILVAHNHPSGDPTPSKQDRELTTSMERAAKAVGIRFLDHIVMAGNKSYSFRQESG
jgi:DNA repair protein RadC